MRNPLVSDSVSRKFVKYTEQQPQAFLLDDLLICILRRLDVRDVARCRCVCKKWKDLMSNSQFEDSLLMPVSNRPMILTKLTIHYEPLGRGALTFESCIDKWWRTETLIPKVGSIRYNGKPEQSSQNGFIFTRIGDSFPYKNIVRNPMTDEQVTIFLYKESLPERVLSADILGIFLHPILRDQYYTIWRVQVLDYSANVYRTQYKMLNLGSAGQPTCWRNIGHLWRHRWIPDTSVVCLDGFMYWMVNLHSNGNVPFVPLIISFDMKTEDFIEIPLPSTYTHFQFEYPSNILNADGSLSLVQVVVDEAITVKMWTLKDRIWTASQYVLGQVKCYTKLWKKQPHRYTMLHQSPRAVAIVNNRLVIEGKVGDDESSESRGLFVCNLEYGTLRSLTGNKYSWDARFWVHYPTIASLRNCLPVLHITQE